MRKRDETADGDRHEAGDRGDRRPPDPELGERSDPEDEQRIETEIHEAKNRVRDAMNSALIAIGSRSDELEQRTLEVAERVGKVEVDHGETGCKTPLAASYIPKSREQMRKKEAKRDKAAAR